MRPAAGFERPLPEASSGPGGDADERGARAMPSGNTHHASDEAPALKEQIASCHRRTFHPPRLGSVRRVRHPHQREGPAAGAAIRFLEISLAPCLGAILKVKLRLLRAGSPAGIEIKSLHPAGMR